MHRRHALLLATTALIPLGVSAAFAGGPAPALPEGGAVQAGGASISTSASGSTLTVNQTTDRAIINWNTFNIGAGGTVRINMPGSNSVELDRVTGGLGPSQIFGTLTSNGIVYLVNPNGILFGQGAVVDTAGFLATTHDIKCAAGAKLCENSNFMAGRYNFTVPGNPSASIVNKGNITAATGGFAALVAPGVRNSGTITATLGTVGLSAANGFSLDLYGDRLITLSPSDSIAKQVTDVATGRPLASLVTNTGRLSADGGRVQLTAAAARAVVSSVINTKGVIEANAVGQRGGTIVLAAATGATKPGGAPVQTVKVTGRISAKGGKAGQKGGTVEIAGEDISLTGAKINASGMAGGGTVLVGGNGAGAGAGAGAVTSQGATASPPVPTATTVTADGATKIDASAKYSGDGGKVVVWSDQATSFAGQIKAAGGANAGNGGSVETSGGSVNFAGIRVDTSAPTGKTGTWLVDPTDLTVDQAAAATIAQNLQTTNVKLQTNADGTTSGPGTTSTGPGNPGDIIVAAPISWTSANALTLDAYHDVTVSAAIASTGGGNITLHADHTGTGVGTVTFGEGGSVSTTGQVAIFYNPSVNPAGSLVNASSYVNPVENYSNNGGGTLTAYMLVNTVNDLQNVQNNLTGTYALGRNIDASAAAGWNSGAGFVPIGNSDTNFAGTFNGRGKTISNLFINLPDNDGVGLFGYVGGGGLIQNVGLLGGGVTGNGSVGALVGNNAGTVAKSYATAQVSATGGDDAGGLVGYNSGTVRHSYATGPVSGPLDVGGLVGDNDGTVTRSYATGPVTGTNTSSDFGVGGLVGYMSGGSVTQSYATGKVTAPAYVGGLVGWSTGSISQSYSIGAVNGSKNVGGLVGYNAGNVRQTYASGRVTGTVEATNVGALVGLNDEGGKVSSSYWDTTINPLLGGFGTNYGSFSAQGRTTSQFSNASNFSGWSFGTVPGGSSCGDGACWVIVDTDGSLNNGGDAAGATRPMLLSEWSKTISNPHQLQLMTLDPTANYKLANDINLGAALANPSDVWGPSIPKVADGIGSFVPVGTNGDWFIGTFWGKGHTIDGLNIALSDPNLNNIGLFGGIGPGGFVNNLTLTNASITANRNVSGPGQFVGTLAGENAGTILGVTVSGTINGLPGGNSVAGVIAGGLVGQNGMFGPTQGGGTISGSNATVKVTIGDGCFGDCSSGFNVAGGLVGSNPGTISASNAYGAVTVGANANAGGLVGQNQNWDSQNNPIAGASIDGSSASGAVSSAGWNVSLGGLAGNNAPLSAITNSTATGAVTSTATVQPNQNQNCSNGGNGNCLYVQAGGLAGQNAGTISGSSASGDVSVGWYAQAGGLVGQNGNFGGDNSFFAGTILDSSASGKVSSDGVNVQIGGLVGSNAPLSTITNSQASGAVTSTASLTSNSRNCSGSSTCQYVDVGGFVGQNLGTISGTPWPWKTPPDTCGASYACASGNVAVGQLGQGGGFAGQNDGIISYAFAIGNVTGAAGLPSTASDKGPFNNQTQLGGFAQDNSGRISHSFAIGAVGTAGTPYLAVAGFVNSNEGTITKSSASGAVSAGDSSTAGGFAGNNSPGNNCFGVCGGGHNDHASITKSRASGDVTVGNLSVAGGFAASGGSSKSGGSNTNTIVSANISTSDISSGNGGGSGSSTFDWVKASGAVNAGGNSMVGGLVGALLPNSTLSNSSAKNTLVASSGPNSMVGGIAGLNAGTISNSTSSAPVSGAGSSFIGGLVGINGGVITRSSTAPVSGAGSSFIGGLVGINGGVITGSSTYPTVTGTGSNNFIGGIAGLNVGTIDGSTAQVTLSGGPSSFVGGVAGVNGTYTNVTATLPGSTFPTGSIATSTATGDGAATPVGSSTPSFAPAVPAWLGSCTDTVCVLLTTGTLGTSQPSGGGGGPADTTGGMTTGNYGTQQTTFLTTPPPTVTTDSNQPVVTPINLGPQDTGTGGAGGNGSGGNGNGGNANGGGGGGSGDVTGSLGNGRQGGNGAPPGVRLIDMPVMPLPPGSGMPPPGETRFAKDEIMVQALPGVTPERVAEIAQMFGLTVILSQQTDMFGRPIYILRTNGKPIRDAIAQINANHLGIAVQPIYQYKFAQSAAAPVGEGDANLGDPAQYVVGKFHLADSHRISRGDTVTIAVIDSEIDANHPDLAGVVSSRFDAGCGATAPDAHGTGMAGAIASHDHLLGIAPGAKVIAICAFGGEGTAESTSLKIIKGLDYAIAQGARIVNMSFAGPRDPALAQALQVAREKGVVLIGAAGNAGPKSPPLYPGADPNVIAVTATDDHDRLFKGANQGKYIAVAAPGVDILVPAPNEGIQLTTGTSVATAHVSGVAALLLSQKPSRTPEEIRAILMSTAKDLGPKGIDPQFGAGLVDPLKALRTAPAVVSQNQAAAGAAAVAVASRAR